MPTFQPLPERLEQSPDTFLVPLSDWGVVKIEGEDAAKFLHSQLTIDVNKLQSGSVRRSAHCDFKGKAWCIGLLACNADTYWLLGDNVAVAASLEQFKKYGVFSKITLTDFTSEYSLLASHGADLSAVFDELPAGAMSLVANESGFCLQLDYPEQTCLLAISKSEAERLQANSNIYPPALFEALSIAAGIPALSDSEHINQFVPQMMNLQALDSIDFNKGCYMGQEVVARTRYLGKNKRAAAIFKLNQALADSAEAKLEKQVGEHWRSGGTILRTAELGAETWILAIVNNDTTKDDVFRLSTLPSVELIHCALPYTLET